MKKVILTIILAFAIVFIVCGCESEDREELIENNGCPIYSVDILQNETLIYDKNTRIVYMSQYTYNGHAVYILYLSENGLPYRYVDGELVEVGQ